MNTPMITTVAAQTTTATESPTSVLVTRQTVEKSPVEIPVVSCPTARSVVTSSSAKVMPVFYIQSSSSGTVRVAPANGTTAASTAGTSTIQKLPTAPRIVAGAHSVKQPTQHLVIQQAGGKQYAYVGTIIKPHGNKELLLSAGVLPKLAPAPAPPPPTVNVAANQPPAQVQVTGSGNTASNKMTSLLVTLPPGAQHVPSKPGMINLKISNGQIHTDNKGCITVLRDSSKVLPTTPTLQPATVKPNGLLIPEVTSSTLTLTPVSSEAHTQSVPIVTQQPVILPAPPVLQPQQPRPEPLVQQRQRVQQQQPQQQQQQQQQQQLQQQQKPQQLQLLQHHPQKQQQVVQLQPEQQQHLLQQQQKVKQEQQQLLQQQQKVKQEQQQQKLKQEQQLQKLKQEQQQQLQKLKQEQQQQKHQLVPSSCAIAVVPTTGTATVISVPAVVTSSHGTLSVVPKLKEDSTRINTVVTTVTTTSITSVTTVSSSALGTVPAALKAKDDSGCTVTAATIAGTTAVITVPVSVSPSPRSASGTPKMVEDNTRTSVLATSTATASLITIPNAGTTPHATVSVAPKMKEDSVRTTSVLTTAGTTIISIPAAVSPSPTTVCAAVKSKEDGTRNTQDLNRCLQEAVDSFSPPHVQNDEVTLIKVVKPDGPDASPRPAQLPPEDDVKIELVKQDVTVRQSQPPTQATDIDSDDFDPMKVLEWKNGVGTLPGSDLKFRMNEFGIMEMIDEDDCEKLKQDCKSAPEAQECENAEQTSATNDCSSILKAVDKREEKHSSTTPSLQQQVIRPPKKENPSGGNSGQAADGGSSSSGTDEIYCCEGCGCYGLSTEFVSSRFCSDLCASNFANRRAQQSKRERDLLLLRLRRRKKRLLQLMQQQQSQNYARHRLRPMPRDRQLLQHLQHHYARAVQSGMVSSTAKENCEIEISAQPVAKSDETADDVSDDKTTVSWLSSKKGFLWPKYLEHCKGKQAPQKLFRDPFPYMKNGFKVGMKLEGIDPEHPSYFCVLTVSDVQGYRIRLHFDGYPDNYDFWVNADSVDIFPAGWCEKNNHKLHPPKGYSPASFNWNAYLKQCHAQAAPRNLFANKPGNAVCPSGFRIGMKLEAVDRKNKNLVCVATVADIVDNRILVHFDGLDEAFDYWADPSSPYIHPVGWCEEHNRQLTPPKTHHFPQQFSWPQYLRETKSVPAPARAFKQRPPSGFRPGMHLECVDKRVPQLIRVATVSAVRGHQLRIEFDGWPREYGYWVDDDAPDLHPVGWCQKTGHPLEPPLVPEETGSNSECPILGCNGVGHIKGPKFAMHTSAEFCPYAPGNFQCMAHISDRLSDKVASTETQSETCSSEKMKVQEPHKNPVGRPAKRRRVESCEEPKSLIVVQEEEEPAAKKDRHFLESTSMPVATSDSGVQGGEDLGNGSTVRETSTSPNPLAFASSSQKDSADITQLELEVRNSVRSPGYDPQPSQGPIPWTQHTKYLNTFLAAVPQPPELVSHWTCNDVSTFLRSIPGCAHAVNAFAEQEVDGDALVLMSQDDLVKAGGLKLGPAVKLYNCVVLLRQLKGQAEGQIPS
ncbi:lethal(3)malignant brain tumor-like protein 3 [Schistocerca americana]|uniref:lethal(3)malignant brain tumor-like protein 3 n=1 Tax=Schistocerca americana TaxID=7009 RepID=UPI001F4F4864|nr:lethal(3)malignant brain tumor-like protein 3 [Schistocerca americana]